MIKKRIIQAARFLASRLGLLKDDLRNHRILSKYRTNIQLNTLEENVKVWVIGCGRMGIQFIKAINKTNQLDLIGVTDLNEAIIKDLVNNMDLGGIQTTSELKPILNIFDKQKDILVIATTANSHFSIMEWALKENIKKIFLEKPLTNSLRQGEQLVELVKASDALVYVDHTRRWMRSFLGLKQLLASGMIGKTERVYLPYGEGGIAMIGSHFVDLVRFLFDKEVVKIHARIDKQQKENMRGPEFVDPTGIFTLILSSGLEVVLDLSNGMTRKNHLMYFLGTLGRIEIDVENEDLWVFQNTGKHWKEKFPWSVDKQNALINALAELALGKQPRCSTYDGYKAIEAVIAGVQAGQSNNIEKLPLQDSIAQKEFPFA